MFERVGEGGDQSRNAFVGLFYRPCVLLCAWILLGLDRCLLRKVNLVRWVRMSQIGAPYASL